MKKWIIVAVQRKLGTGQVNYELLLTNPAPPSNLRFLPYPGCERQGVRFDSKEDAQNAIVGLVLEFGFTEQDLEVRECPRNWRR